MSEPRATDAAPDPRGLDEEILSGFAALAALLRARAACYPDYPAGLTALGAQEFTRMATLLDDDAQAYRDRRFTVEPSMNNPAARLLEV